ncbi:uncharacterized protein JCM6883_000774 [Sporobolomyces salmoneus]|uniref:uncharacterized protein n=1 Tax=Sporobolomyces salmoneus TaxID=183962 RepID=UPI00316EC7F4
MSEDPSSMRLRLPTELYKPIFLHLESFSQDLYHVLRACRCFYEVAKPILYRHIIITTREQRKRLENVKEEDKKLVRHVTIKGDGPIDVDDVQDHFESEHCKLGEDCLSDLLMGTLLDVSVIETLHILNVHEADSEASVWGKVTAINTEIASNLVELSVWGHQGGARIWETYLTRGNVPKLRRLGYWGVTRYELRGDSDESDEEECECDCCCEDVELFEDDKVELGKNFPLFQLQVLVAASPSTNSLLSRVPKSLRPRTLVVSPEDSSPDVLPPVLSLHNFRYIFSTISGFSAFVMHHSKVKLEDSRSTRHFFVAVRSHSSVMPSFVNLNDLLAPSNIVMHGMKEEEYDSNATSLIFPSFIKFLEESGQLASEEK